MALVYIFLPVTRLPGNHKSVGRSHQLLRNRVKEKCMATELGDSLKTQLTPFGLWYKKEALLCL